MRFLLCSYSSQNKRMNTENKMIFFKKLIFTELQLFLLLEIKIKITEMPKVLRVVHKNPLKCACPRLHGAVSELGFARSIVCGDYA